MIYKFSGSFDSTGTRNDLKSHHNQTTYNTCFGSSYSKIWLQNIASYSPYFNMLRTPACFSLRFSNTLDSDEIPNHFLTKTPQKRVIALYYIYVQKASSSPHLEQHPGKCPEKDVNKWVQKRKNDENNDNDTENPVSLKPRPYRKSMSAKHCKENL